MWVADKRVMNAMHPSIQLLKKKKCNLLSYIFFLWRRDLLVLGLVIESLYTLYFYKNVNDKLSGIFGNLQFDFCCSLLETDLPIYRLKASGSRYPK